MVNAAIKVTFVEDSADDFDLAVLALRRSGLLLEARRVETEIEFRDALKDVPDVILADYRLPQFSGLVALKIWQELRPDIPFIVVTGPQSEGVAIESLKAGAMDYVLKSNWTHLAEAVKGALRRQTHRRQLDAGKSDQKQEISGNRTLPEQTDDSLRFSALAETVEGIVLIHQKGRCRFANRAAELILGYTQQEILARNFWEFIHPDFQSIVRERGLRREAGDPVPSRYEFPVVTKTGETRWLDCSASRLRVDGASAVLVSAFDITAHRQAEVERHEIEALKSAIMSSALDCIIVVDHAGHIVEFNPAAEKVFGYSRDEVLGQPMAEKIVPAALREQHYVGLKRFLATGRGQVLQRRVEMVVMRADGMEFPVELAIVPIHRCGPPLFAAYLRDITEQKRVIESMRASEERFRMLFDSAPIGMALHDSKGRYIQTNRAYQAMLGYTNEELLRLGVKNVTHSEDVVEGQKLFAALVNGQCDTYQRDKSFHRKDGRVVWARSTASAIRGDDGKLNFIISMVEDITEHKKAERRSQIFAALAHALNNATKPRDAAKIIVDAARELLGWDACYLHLQTKAQLIVPVLTMDTVNGETVEVLPSSFTLDPSPIMIRVMSEGPLLINRQSAEDAKANPVPLVAFGDKNRPSASMLYVAIRDAEQTIGILSIQSYTREAYDQDDLLTLEALGGHCGGALKRIQTRATLEEIESKNRALLQALPDWVFRCRPDGTVLDSKAPQNLLLPVLASPSAGTHLRDVLPEPILKQFLQGAERTIQSGETQRFEFRHIVEDDLRHYEARLLMSGADDLLAVVADVTARKQLEQEIMEISDAERRHVGHELHDGFGQFLGGIAFKAKSIEQSLANERGPHAREVSEVVRLLQDAMHQVRSIASGLDPVEIGTGSVDEAFAGLVRQIEDLFRVKCLFESNCAGVTLNTEAKVHLYRIAQEAINNSVRHGEVRQVQIRLHVEENVLSLSIKDNGIGFSLKKPVRRGLGLRSMELRANACGGKLTIESSKESGTTVTCSIPLKDFAE